MPQAIAQSATQVAVSPAPEDEFDFLLSVKRNAERTAKGITRERQLLQYNKLISACCADFRAHYPAIYGKTERLPSDIFQKIEKVVTEFIAEQLNRVNQTNVIGLRRGFHHNEREMAVTERIQTVGENKLTYKEQLLGITIFITQAEKRLKDLQSKPTPDYDREKALQQQIMRYNLTKDFIQREITNQEKAKEAITT